MRRCRRTLPGSCECPSGSSGASNARCRFCARRAKVASLRNHEAERLQALAQGLRRGWRHEPFAALRPSHLRTLRGEAKSSEGDELSNVVETRRDSKTSPAVQKRG